jgi:NAD(P)-dependent dehydrogenase (short-subunit alcohol dehydrogenase family)
MWTDAFAPTLFAGKVALVTGGTSGIGLATAELFARAGAAAVFVNGRDPDAGAAAVERLRGCGSAQKVAFLRADYTRDDDVASMFEEIAEWAGGLDILVHTASGVCGRKAGRGVVSGCFQTAEALKWPRE